MAIPMTEEMNEYLLGYVHATSFALKVLIDTLPGPERALFNERFESTKDALEGTSYQTRIKSHHARKGFDEAAAIYLSSHQAAS